MKTALYARVSSDMQVEKDLSISAQLRELREYAKERNWEIFNEYVDEGVSALSADRPQFQLMIMDAQQERFNVILVHKLNRFARNREDAIVYKSLLRKIGIQVISVTESIDDTPSGHLLEGMIEVLDEFYSRNLAQETLKGQKENALRGYNNGGVPPFGYKAKKVSDDKGNEKTVFEPDPVNVPYVQELYTRYAQGEGLQRIADDFNTRGIKPLRSDTWQKSSLFSILRNLTYTGCRVWNREENKRIGVKYKPKEQWVIVTDAHPAIISKELFELVQERIEKRNPEIYGT